MMALKTLMLKNCRPRTTCTTMISAWCSNLFQATLVEKLPTGPPGSGPRDTSSEPSYSRDWTCDFM
jgi:hypothetical protein